MPLHSLVIADPDSVSGLEYRVTYGGDGKVRAVCRRLHFGYGPDLRLDGRAAKHLIKLAYEQTGGRIHG